jgi:hypothetical protein
MDQSGECKECEPGCCRLRETPDCRLIVSSHCFKERRAVFAPRLGLCLVTIDAKPARVLIRFCELDAALHADRVGIVGRVKVHRPTPAEALHCVELQQASCSVAMLIWRSALRSLHHALLRRGLQYNPP